MEAALGSRVEIRFQCRLKNSKARLDGVGGTQQLVLGAGSFPPTLERGLLGMKPGERRTVIVSSAEANRFPFLNGSQFAKGSKTPPGISYEFGPGNGGDVTEMIPPGEAPSFLQPSPASADLCFEVEMLAVEDPRAGQK